MATVLRLSPMQKFTDNSLKAKQDSRVRKNPRQAVVNSQQQQQQQQQNVPTGNKTNQCGADKAHYFFFSYIQKQLNGTYNFEMRL